MKKFFANIALLAIILSPMAIAIPVNATTLPNWDVTGNYTASFNYQDAVFQTNNSTHDMLLSEDSFGNLTGKGGTPAGTNAYTWVLTSGLVSGNDINFSAKYDNVAADAATLTTTNSVVDTDTAIAPTTSNTTATDVTTSLTMMNVTGKIATDGTMSGTWSDNYKGGHREGTWATTTGAAKQIELPIAPSNSIMFWYGKVNQHVDSTTGLWMTDPDGTSGADIDPLTYCQKWYPNTESVSSGIFQTISTWQDKGNVNFYSNTKPSLQCVQSLPTLLGTLAAQDFGVMNVSDVKGYTAGFGLTDATLAGATSVVTQLYSGTNLLQTDTAIIPKFNADITGTQFSSPFDVFGTFNYVTDGYWTNVRGSEYGQTLIPNKVVATVTLANGKVVTAENTNITGDVTTIFPAGTIGGTVTGGTDVGVLAITGVTAVKTNATADGTFPNGWEYTFNITIPSNETHLGMKFANWASTTGSSNIPVANNMRISSVQANNAGATVLLGEGGIYSSPTLNITGDLDTTLVGNQIQVKVEVAIPTTAVNGSYSTSYGVETQ